MTYVQFLALFLFIPIALLAFGMRRHVSRRDTTWLALLMLLALSYTTPWDNYLVASGVWACDPPLVTGITIGWVPVEEYTFFLLQPLLTGLWVLFLRHSGPTGGGDPEHRWIRILMTSIVIAIWSAAMPMLLLGWESLRYLSLILTWALPPIGLQMAFGAEILFAERAKVALGLVPAPAFLCAADALAILEGIWTINLESSVGIFLGGILPLEEALFFFLTNTLIVSALILLRAEENQKRLDHSLNLLFNRFNRVQG
jgi:lycopene cyclase domain-containing protein